MLEIEFIYNKKKYSILPINAGIVVLEQYNEESKIVFKAPISVGEYLLDGRLLKDVIIEAEITFRCFD